MTKKFFFNKNNTKFKLNDFKLMFFITLITSTLISINSNSWINAWLGMEINLMSFIPLMINKKMTPYSTMMYFIVQTTASSMILMTSLLMKIEMNLYKLNMMFSMIQFSLMMKLGSAPMHWWTPKVFINMDWKMGFTFLTWQKISPIILLNSSYNNNIMIYMMMIMSVITGAILGLNQSLIKMIMIYSSINHMGWMLMTLILNKMLMIIYFMIYSTMNFMICIIMNNLNIKYLSQLMKNFNQNLVIKMMMMSLFLSLGGMPPLLGFLPKMLTLMSMMKNNFYMESLIFILMATLTLSFYMNPMMSMFLSMKLTTKWNKKNSINILKINSIFIMNIILSLMITPMILKLNII